MDVHPQFINALDLGTMPPVDVFPFLTLVPEWCVRWKKTIRHIRYLHETLFNRLLSKVEMRIQSGHESGFMGEAISKASEWGLNSRDHLM